jgi:hypothetical protein
MLFNSPEYALFLPLAVLLYWLLARSWRAQNGFLLVASYIFYGWWDWRFLGLLIATSVVDYFVGLGIERADDKRTKRLILVWSLAANLGTLGFFKYYNFFIGSFTDAFASLGIELHPATLQVILPVGVSFYTFQALTYTIGVYRGTVRPTRDLMTFLSYVAFFPQLVAGPIERAQHMLPQFLGPRSIDAAKFASGLRQIAWGLFCKLAVADNCAVIVNAIFAEPGTQSGSVAFLGALFFAFAFPGPLFSVFIELFKLACELDMPASRLVPIGPGSLDRFAGIVNLLFKQEFLTFEIGKRFTKDIQILLLRGLRQKMLPSSVLLGGPPLTEGIQCLPAAAQGLLRIGQHLFSPGKFPSRVLLAPLTDRHQSRQRIGSSHRSRVLERFRKHFRSASEQSL